MLQLQDLIPYIVIVSHIVLATLFFAALARRSWGREATHFVGKHALPLSFFVSLAAVVGSLFYSEVVGFEPCVLCWWQRVFLYPTLVLFALAAWQKDRGIFLYSSTLALLAGVIALYHSYVYMGGTSILPCTALGGACSKVFVYAFGYITIPSMSLTVVLYLLLLAWANKLYQRS